MITPSGARFEFSEHEVIKHCDNATLQVAWFRSAEQRGFVAGVRAVPVRDEREGSYAMSRLTPHPPTGEHVDRLVAQVRHWAGLDADNDASWSSYLERLDAHASLSGSPVIGRAVEVVAAHPPFTPSWCHGDLTLDNVIARPGGEVVLIDPNYHPGLYQSFVLDLGKLLQSTHTVYNRDLCGVDAGFGAFDEYLVTLLRELGVFPEALRACLSHVVRLVRYRPHQIAGIERIARELLDELESLT